MGSVGKPGMGKVWPVGAGFRPRDDELLNHYLKRKLRGLQEDCQVIPELDIYGWEPQALFEKYDEMSDLKSDGRECFFFCVREGSNRMTRTGFWKETRKRQIVKDRDGKPTWSKRILVYYEGRQPKGRKSQYSMHEYHLKCPSKPTIKGPTKEIVLCRFINRAIKKTSPDSPSFECIDPDPVTPGGAIADQGDNEGSPWLRGITNGGLAETNPDGPSSECIDPDPVTPGGASTNRRDDQANPQVWAPLNSTETVLGMPSIELDDAEMEELLQLLCDDDDQHLFTCNDQFRLVGDSSNIFSYSDCGPGDDDGLSISELSGS